MAVEPLDPAEGEPAPGALGGEGEDDADERHVEVGVTTAVDGLARDLFEVTSRRRDKLDDVDKARVVAALAGEAPARSRLRSPWAHPALRGGRPAPVPEA